MTHTPSAVDWGYGWAPEQAFEHTRDVMAVWAEAVDGADPEQMAVAWSNIKPNPLPSRHDIEWADEWWTPIFASSNSVVMETALKLVGDKLSPMVAVYLLDRAARVGRHVDMVLDCGDDALWSRAVDILLGRKDAQKVYEPESFPQSVHLLPKVGLVMERRPQAIAMHMQQIQDGEHELVRRWGNHMCTALENQQMSLLYRVWPLATPIIKEAAMVWILDHLSDWTPQFLLSLSRWCAGDADVSSCLQNAMVKHPKTEYLDDLDHMHEEIEISVTSVIDRVVVGGDDNLLLSIRASEPGQEALRQALSKNNLMWSWVAGVSLSNLNQKHRVDLLTQEPFASWKDGFGRNVCHLLARRFSDQRNNLNSMTGSEYILNGIVTFFTAVYKKAPHLITDTCHGTSSLALLESIPELGSKANSLRAMVDRDALAAALDSTTPTGVSRAAKM